jgi:hypothetical protein
MHNNLHAGSVLLNKRTGQIKLTNLEYSRNMKAEDTDKDFESLLSVISPYLIAPV